MPAELKRRASGRVAEPQDDALEIGARLVRPPAREMVETAFASELDAQRALAKEIGLADLAHTVVLIERGIVPLESGRQLLGALLELLELGGNLPLRPELGDLHTNREAWLAARCKAAGWLGAGRARREATTTAWHMLVRRRLLDLADGLVQCGVTLVARAAALREALAPDYTYLQPGQASTAGHYLLTFAFPMLRDLDRLRGHLDRVDLSPAGCGSANGSSLGYDRHRLAGLLGFPAPVIHARDAMWQADLPVESLGVAVAALLNADRLVEDLLYFCAPGIDLFSLSDIHCRASKILPHKRNPYALAHVRGVANRLIGVQATVASAGRMPTGQIDSRALPYAEVPRALEEAAGAISLLESVVAELHFNQDAATARLAESFVTATDLAEAIMVEAKVDHRSAQRIVGALAREVASAGRSPGEVTASEVKRAAVRVLGVPVEVPADAVARALDPRAVVAGRLGTGGASPEVVAEMAGRCRDELVEHAEELAARRTRVAGAERMLLEVVERIRGGHAA